jgi:hypothetical protein
MSFAKSSIDPCQQPVGAGLPLGRRPIKHDVKTWGGVRTSEVAEGVAVERIL